MSWPSDSDATPPRIICLGLSALDEIWQVGSLFDAQTEKIRANDHRQVGGGIAATAAVAIARLGAKAAFWGRAGEDVGGTLMRDWLVDEGIDVAGFRLFPGGRSSVSCVIVDAAGERQIANFRGDFPDDSAWLPLHAVAGAAAVLADPRWPAGARALFQAARAAGVPTILDGEVAPREDIVALLPLTDHAVFSTPGLAAFAGADGLDAVAAHGCRVAAVTRGADGVEWHDAAGAHRQAAFRVEAVDTTGAGDVFHGAYAAAIGGRESPAAAFAFAAATAALKCTRPDGRSGIPSLPEALAFLRKSPCPR